MDPARRMYQEIMGHCSDCHSRIDPLVKEKVADLSFAAGMHDTAILELYLALAQASSYALRAGGVCAVFTNRVTSDRAFGLKKRRQEAERSLLAVGLRTLEILYVLDNQL